ncbi:tetratricopeptide repeat protein [Mangrovibacterium marinum]|uniref:histidine kinase n=1 Tax=Mangrovibacterium marinum TaxID=1639118 RepID=A0A2T5C1P9_9BACT|nr:tetratricopeptide repeat protein [Mangrovibacterium marinum]PTN08532.1 tetratricopeptide repeat protein [Mangrovibacterium marinum]
MKRIVYQLVCIVIGCLFTLSSNGQTAKIDSLTNLIPGLRGTELCQVYLDLAKEYNFVDPRQVIYYANLALPIAEQQKDKVQQSMAYQRLGAGYIFSGEFEQGYQVSEKALKLAREVDDGMSIIGALNAMAACHMNLGEYPKALELFREALTIAEKIDAVEAQASIELNIGAALTTQGDRTNGLLYLFKALKYYENRGDHPTLARILNNIAVNYHYWKDYNRALDYYLKTLEAYQSMDDRAGQIIVLNNIGEIYKDKREFAKAVDFFDRVVQVADSSELSTFYKAYGWVGLAEAYMEMGEFEKSSVNVSQALAVFEKVKMQEGIATANLIRAQLSLKNNQPEAGLVQVNRCLEIAQASGVVDLEQKAYRVRAQIYKMQNRFKLAYDDVDRYATMSDTLYRTEIAEKFADIRAAIEITKKQNEIELLQMDNQIMDLKIKRQHSSTVILMLIVLSLFVVSLVMFGYLKSRKRVNELLTEKNSKIRIQHEELMKVNETKDKFMSIIGHDLRNPIGAFKDVISQLADFPEMFTDELRQQIVKELREEAESTYFLLDNLLSWAKNQKDAISFKPEKLDLRRVVKSNIQLNNRLLEAKSIAFTSDLEGELLALADHNMVNLVLRNLISNAIKFTNDGGQIQIVGREEQNLLVISVKDNGVGIAEEDLPLVFDPVRHLSTYGTKHEKGSGLGLLLCKEFVEINGGTITVDSHKGVGSTFTFTLQKLTGEDLDYSTTESGKVNGSKVV